MTNEIIRTRAVFAPMTGMLIKIVTGTVALAASSTLFTSEAMKMEINENTQVPGLFTSFLAAGTAVMAGKIIGYFTPTDET